MMRRVLKSAWHPEFWANDDEFYSEPGRAPRSSCILDVTKLLSTGVKMRPVKEALADALRKWRPAFRPVPLPKPVFEGPVLVESRGLGSELES